MGTLIQDLRYGVRMLRKNPGFTAVAVMTLALGIGANTAIFSLIETVLLRSLPVERPEELFVFGDGLNSGLTMGIQSGSWDLFSYPLYEHFRDARHAFEDLCAVQSFRMPASVKVTGPHKGAAEMAGARLVSANYFSVLGVKALARRMLELEDDSEARPVAVLSYAYWTHKFARDPSAVGSTVFVNGTPIEVAGVAPPGFFGETLEGDPADLWIPIALEPRVMAPWAVQFGMSAPLLKSDDVHWLIILGRLKSGATVRQAQAELNVQLKQFLGALRGSKLSEEDRRRVAESHLELTPGARGISELRNGYERPLEILMVAVALVLLIACSNIANLLLARSAGRQSEITVRLALGASRARLVRQFLTESVLLALLGGLAALLLASWAASTLLALLFGGARTIPITAQPDWPVVAFTLVVSSATAALFGIAPALRASGVDLVPALKVGSRTVLGAHSARSRLGRSLVVSQVALSLLLLVGAGLLLRSLAKLENQDLGFDRENMLLVGIDPALAGYRPAQVPNLYRRLQERIAALPGVRSATLAQFALASDTRMAERITVPGYTPAPCEKGSVQVNTVAPRYFETTGMSLLVGRSIGSEDDETSRHVAVINEALARSCFPNQNPIGRRFSLGGGPRGGEELEIVGVVKDAKYNGLREQTPRMVFLPLLQHNRNYAMDIEVRTAGGSLRADDIRRAVQDVDGNLPITRVATLKAEVNRSLNQERLIAELSGVFALFALVLACVGLYGLMSYGVAQRTNEIGVRMALGAERANVLWMVLRESMILIGAGVAIGIPLALALARLIANQLFGLKPSDPLTLIGAAAAMGAVAGLAAYLPARRATKVDPMVALRYE